MTPERTMTDPDDPHPDEELPDFLALGIELLAQSPEGRTVMRRIVHGQLTDTANMFGIDLEGDDE